jgi:hypothetical protein
MTNKFIITISGPAMMYRLDLIKKSSPSIIKDFIIIFTDLYSFNIYKKYGYDRDFNFVIIDGIRENYPVSLKNEKFLEVSNEIDYFKELPRFYNNSANRNNTFYPYDIHRFIFLYCAENNILNFAIVDSDCVFVDSVDIVDRYFKDIPTRTLNTLWFGEDPERSVKERLRVFEAIQPFFPQITLNRDFLRNADGFIRGFHFKNKDDLLLFFNIWNKALEVIFENWTDFFHLTSGTIIYDSAWVSPFIMQFFQNIGYSLAYCHDYLHVKSLGGSRVMSHFCRPEDTFYNENRRWKEYDYNIQYTDIASFIKHNKQQLKKYYEDRLDNVEITDTHVYGKLRQ